ncbi:hypothetical protein VN97_g2401 [Penicillium thymicola]|uniref:Uncharacterized protein n=1 Tax=Penicillium thymicola TaxID=293382 RepID=A0AAI9TP28_PENTH|nr:hypothetical protein VN97_g2401 [Penicillium thymicola]
MDWRDLYLGILPVYAASTLLSSHERGKFPFGVGFVQEAGALASKDCTGLQCRGLRLNVGSKALVTQIREKPRQQDRPVVSGLDGEGWTGGR